MYYRRDSDFKVNWLTVIYAQYRRNNSLLPNPRGAMAVIDKPSRIWGFILVFNLLDHIVGRRASESYLAVIPVAVWHRHKRISPGTHSWRIVQGPTIPPANPWMALELTVLLMNEMDLTRDFGSDEGHLNSFRRTAAIAVIGRWEERGMEQRWQDRSRWTRRIGCFRSIRDSPGQAAGETELCATWLFQRNDLDCFHHRSWQGARVDAGFRAWVGWRIETDLDPF